MLLVCSFSRDAALVLVEAVLFLDVLLLLSNPAGSGLCDQLSIITVFRLLRVGAIDLATFLDLGFFGIVLGTLNAGLSNLSTGLEILLDFFLEEFSASGITGLEDSFSGSGSGVNSAA